MTRTEFYNGWQITIFDYGDLDNPDRIMMAFGQDGKQIDFSGVIFDDDKAIEHAKEYINFIEGKQNPPVIASAQTINVSIDDFPDVIGD